MKLFRYKGWYIERTTILVPNYQPSFYNEAFHQLSSWFFSGYWNWSQLQPEHYGSTFLSNWTLKIKTIYSMFWTPTYNCLSYYSILVSKNSGTLCQRYAQTLQRIKNTNYLQAPKIFQFLTIHLFQIVQIFPFCTKYSQPQLFHFKRSYRLRLKVFALFTNSWTTGLPLSDWLGGEAPPPRDLVNFAKLSPSFCQSLTTNLL